MSFANMGSADRAIRAIVGIALLASPFVTALEVTSLWGILAMVVGAVFVLTSLIAYCPAYPLLGIRTKRKE